MGSCRYRIRSHVSSRYIVLFKPNEKKKAIREAIDSDIIALRVALTQQRKSLNRKQRAVLSALKTIYPDRSMLSEVISAIILGVLLAMSTAYLLSAL